MFDRQQEESFCLHFVLHFVKSKKARQSSLASTDVVKKQQLQSSFVLHSTASSSRLGALCYFLGSWQINSFLSFREAHPPLCPPNSVIALHPENRGKTKISCFVWQCLILALVDCLDLLSRLSSIDSHGLWVFEPQGRKIR